MDRFLTCMPLDQVLHKGVGVSARSSKWYREPEGRRHRHRLCRKFPMLVYVLQVLWMLRLQAWSHNTTLNRARGSWA